MSQSISKARLLVIGSLIVLATTGCGTSKVDQCSNIAKIVTEVKTTADKEFNSQNDKAQSFSNMSAIAQSFSKTLKALDIQDEKLKGLKTSLSSIYSEYVPLFAQSATAIKSKDAKSINSNLARIEAADVREKALIKEMGEYCDGKK